MDSPPSPPRTAVAEAAWLLATLPGEPFAITAHDTSAADDWGTSGAMALTGEPHSRPLLPEGRPATVARAAGLALEILTGAAVDGAALLGERAAIMGLRRAGQVSCGGHTRLLPCADGWWALSLARDLDLVPALIGRDPGDPWAGVAAWARARPAREIITRTTMLGMAAAALGETAAPRIPWRITHVPGTSGQLPRRPLIVSLGALWAAPLAASLLGLAGAEVISVESSTRPDPVRHSAPEFYALLHGHVRTITVDFSHPGDLAGLLARADAVIEASRPRALAALGLAAPDVMADGRPRAWLRITGHRDPDRVAFGDDAAVAGGLVAWSSAQPVFAGDAIADPLTGVVAALPLAAHLVARVPALMDVHLAEVAAYCAAGRAHHGEDPAACPPRRAARRYHDAFA